MNGDVITNSKEMACVLNEYFASVFTPHNHGPVPTPTDKGSASRICDVLITPGMVKKKLLKLNPGSAPGPDGISSRFLKEHAEVLAPPPPGHALQSVPTKRGGTLGLAPPR